MGQIDSDDIRRLSSLLSEIDILAASASDEQFKSWRTKVDLELIRAFGEMSALRMRFGNLVWYYSGLDAGTGENERCFSGARVQVKKLLAEAIAAARFFAQQEMVVEFVDDTSEQNDIGVVASPKRSQFRREAAGQHPDVASLEKSGGPVEKSAKDATASNAVQIIVAVISAIALITVGWWQFGSPQKATPIPIAAEQLSGRVIDAESEQPIRGAKVVLDMRGVPPVLYTDSEGIFTFTLPTNINTVRVRVNVSGYQPFDRTIPLGAQGKFRISD